MVEEDSVYDDGRIDLVDFEARFVEISTKLIGNVLNRNQWGMCCYFINTLAFTGWTIFSIYDVL